MGQLCERFDEDIYAAFPFQRWSKGIYPDIVEGSFMRRPAKCQDAGGVKPRQSLFFKGITS